MPASAHAWHWMPPSDRHLIFRCRLRQIQSNQYVQNIDEKFMIVRTSCRMPSQDEDASCDWSSGQVDATAIDFAGLTIIQLAHEESLRSVVLYEAFSHNAQGFVAYIKMIIVVARHSTDNSLHLR